MLQLICKTPLAIFLVGVADERGVLRFPTAGDAEAPGLRIPVRALVPINEQLVAAASAALGAAVGPALDIVQDFADEMELADGAGCTVYVARLNAARLAPSSQTVIAEAANGWPSFPELLRGMSKTRRRLPFLRAWQVLSGGLELTTKAVDMDEVRRHFDD
jgi:hypothetical protein